MSGESRFHEEVRCDGGAAQQWSGSSLNRLLSAWGCEMPFRDHCFEGIVAVSTLEFLENLDTACLE